MTPAPADQMVEKLEPLTDLLRARPAGINADILRCQALIDYGVCHQALQDLGGLVSVDNSDILAVSVSFFVGITHANSFLSLTPVKHHCDGIYEHHYDGIYERDGLHLRIENGIPSAWFKGSKEQRAALESRGVLAGFTLESLNSPAIWAQLRGAYNALALKRELTDGQSG
jgi:hypothetical protein